MVFWNMHLSGPNSRVEARSVDDTLKGLSVCTTTGPAEGTRYLNQNPIFSPVENRLIVCALEYKNNKISDRIDKNIMIRKCTW
jgi:hypothetical protein